MAVDDKPKIFTAEGAEKRNKKNHWFFQFDICFNDNSCFFRIIPSAFLRALCGEFFEWVFERKFMNQAF